MCALWVILSNNFWLKQENETECRQEVSTVLIVHPGNQGVTHETHNRNFILMFKVGVGQFGLRKQEFYVIF